jgi:hypothetical protein
MLFQSSMEEMVVSMIQQYKTVFYTKWLHCMCLLTIFYITLVGP